MKSKHKWNIVLIFVTFVWGAGYPITKLGLDNFGATWFVGIRFILATLILMIIFRRKLKNITKDMVKCSSIIGFTLCLVFTLNINALNHTSATNVGFYGALAIIFTPFLSRIAYKERIKKKTILSIGIAVIGIYLLSGSNPTGKFIFRLGDYMAVFSAFIYAVTLIITEKLVSKYDTDLLTLLELMFVAIFATIFAAIFEPTPTSAGNMTIVAIIFTAVLGTAAAMLLQNTAQKHVSSWHVALIFTMEPVFGGILSYIMLGENIGVKGIIGSIFIIGALIISELDIFQLKV